MSYVGVVASYGSMKGYGFISSDAFEGGDAFFGRNVLPPELQNVAGRGFELKGRPVVLDLSEADLQQGKRVAAAVRLMVAEGDTCTGIMRSFDHSVGKGWIECQSLDGGLGFGLGDLPAAFQGSTPPADAVISFTVGVAADGTFEARGIAMMDNSPVANMQPQQSAGKGGFTQRINPAAMQGQQFPGMAALQAVNFKGGNGKGAGGFGGGGATYGGGAQAGPLQDGMRLQGTVISYNPEKGFGFLQAASAPGQDIYFKGQGLACTQGMALSFTIKIMPDGKTQAREIAPGLQSGQQYLASVTSYSEKNGWGFFTVPDANQDVYFKKTLLPLEMQNFDITGAVASITIHHTADGKPQAAQAQFLEQPPPGYVAPVGPASKGKGKGGGACGGGFQAGACGGPVATAGVYGAPNGGFGAFGGCQPAAAFGGQGCGAFGGCGGGGCMQMGGGQPPTKRMRVDEGQLTGDITTGAVLSYNAMKGWGFIKSEMVPSGDVWFGRASLPAGIVEGIQIQGKSVNFKLLWTPDGKPQARQMELLD